jgi:hypothetical protein
VVPKKNFKIIIIKNYKKKKTYFTVIERKKKKKRNNQPTLVYSIYYNTPWVYQGRRLTRPTLTGPYIPFWALL